MVEHPRVKRTIAAAVIAVLLAAAAGCSGSTTSVTPPAPLTTVSPPTAGTTTATSTVGSTVGTVTTPTDHAGTTVAGGWTASQQPLIDAYKSYVEAYRQAAMSSDASSASLAATSSGALLTTVKRELTQRKAAGIATKSPTNSMAATQIVSVTVSGSSGDIASCEVDDTVIYHVADGSIVNADVGTVRYAARLELQDGTWKVVARNQVGNILPGEEMQTCLGQPSS